MLNSTTLKDLFNSILNTDIEPVVQSLAKSIWIMLLVLLCLFGLGLFIGWLMVRK